MEITKELLIRYYSETCTEEERLTVEKWLASNNAPEQVDEALLTEVDFNEQKDQIWARLSSDIENQEAPFISLYKKITRYAAVACLLLGITAGIYAVCTNMLYNSRMTYDNIGATEVQQIHMAGMRFTLLPDSEVDLLTSLCKTKGKIDFCGNIALENTLTHNVELELVSDCEKTTSMLKKTIEVGTKYIVFENKDSNGRKFTEVIDMKKASRLPPFLQRKARYSTFAKNEQKRI